MDPRGLFASTSLDLWVQKNRVLSTVLGAVLAAAAGLMIFLNAFDVITGPLQYLAYVLLGFGVALILVPRSTRQPLDEEES